MEYWEKQIRREFLQEMLDRVLEGRGRGKRLVILDIKPLYDYISNVQEKIGEGLDYEFIYRIIFEAAKSQKDFKSLRKDLRNSTLDLYLSLLDDWDNMLYDDKSDKILRKAILALAQELINRLDSYGLYREGELTCRYEGILTYHNAILTML